MISLAVIVNSVYSEFAFPLKSGSIRHINYFLQWIFGGLICLVFLAFKLSLSSIFSRLFSWKDVSGFQFFNFVRALVVLVILLGVIAILFTSFNFEVNYNLLMKIFFGLLMIEPVLMFFKLMTRESARPFHLFSYLCATEIFPLISLIKVFLF